MDSKGTIVVQKGDLRTLFDLVCSPLAGHNPIKCIHAALHRGVCLIAGSTVSEERRQGSLCVALINLPGPQSLA